VYDEEMRCCRIARRRLVLEEKRDSSSLKTCIIAGCGKTQKDASQDGLCTSHAQQLQKIGKYQKKMTLELLKICGRPQTHPDTGNDAAVSQNGDAADDQRKPGTPPPPPPMTPPPPSPPARMIGAGDTHVDGSNPEDSKHTENDAVSQTEKGVTVSGAGSAQVNGWYTKMDAPVGDCSEECGRPTRCKNKEGRCSECGATWSGEYGSALPENIKIWAGTDRVAKRQDRHDKFYYQSQGRPWFEKDDGCLISSNYASWWCESPNGTPLYFVKTDAALPPAEGWEPYNTQMQRISGGRSPAPQMRVVM